MTFHEVSEDEVWAAMWSTAERARPLAQALQAIRADHQNDHGYCTRCWDGDPYDLGAHPWPCPTIRALTDIYPEEQQ
ncbi:hypothetical protein [Nocardia flavorosea]|uniref:Uncharacterized protein n=1 Tax=Nocardia flavorosea TaxID=53429 RepID=A0A846YN16_9NOCA|nr:hypothetical protein [Nocardia flavorosea]NKY60445.1 hypothetical protein [Nocardia flavorosea]